MMVCAKYLIRTIIFIRIFTSTIKNYIEQKPLKKRNRYFKYFYKSMFSLKTVIVHYLFKFAQNLEFPTHLFPDLRLNIENQFV